MNRLADPSDVRSHAQEQGASDELRQLRVRVQQLEAELRTRDEFISAAAHELRNPISPLVLQVQRLSNASRSASDGSVSAAWLGEQCDLLNRRLSRFMSALNRILDVSRIQTGRIELVIDEPVDLCDVARDIVAGFERELAASGSALTLQAEGEIWGAWDRMRLEQVVSNLVSNAIRYGNSEPITVLVTQNGTEATLTVADRGIGISEADRPRIFERFERAHVRNRAGFGVGLWIVRELVDAMRGHVSVESSPGAGSSFHVVLPIQGAGSGDDR